MAIIAQRSLTLIFFLATLAAWAAEPAVDWDKVKAETLQHYQSIVRINTSNPPGNETSLVNYLRGVLDSEGIGYQVFALDPNRANLVARTPNLTGIPGKGLTTNPGKGSGNPLGIFDPQAKRGFNAEWLRAGKWTISGSNLTGCLSHSSASPRL